jgi:ribosomal protein S18 acetylase RimI-like enzyme
MSQSSIDLALDIYQNECSSTVVTDSSCPSSKENTLIWVTNPSFHEVRTCIGKSFAGTESIPGEPVTQWILPSNLKENNDWYTQEEHVNTCKFALGLTIYEVMMHKNKCLAIGGRTARTTNDPHGCDGNQGDELAAAAIIVEYDPKKKKEGICNKLVRCWRMVCAYRKMTKKTRIPTLFSTNCPKKQEKFYISKKAKAFGQKVQDWHKRNGPKEVHWYVMFVAVSPENHGQGRGRELMGKISELADKTGSTLYLECGVQNKKFYEKMGYVVHSETDIADPVDESTESLKLFSMIRTPHQQHDGKLTL